MFHMGKPKILQASGVIPVNGCEGLLKVPPGATRNQVKVSFPTLQGKSLA
jgi:hypothetical protein